MIIRKITAKEISANAVERWRKQYEGHPPDWKFANGMTVAKMNDAFDSMPHTPENIARQMGNRSWTHPQCKFCGDRKDECAEIKDEWGDERVIICKPCADKIPLIW